MALYNLIPLSEPDFPVKALLAGYANNQNVFQQSHFGPIVLPRVQNILVRGKSVDRAWETYCADCPAFNFQACPGGYFQLIQHKGCAYNHQVEDEERIVQKELLPHMVSFKEKSASRAIHAIREDPKGFEGSHPFINMQTYPYALGNVYSSGEICIPVSRSQTNINKASQAYYQLWGSIHTGHIWPALSTSIGLSLDRFIEQFDPDWLLDPKNNFDIAQEAGFKEWISFNDTAKYTDRWKTPWWVDYLDSRHKTLAFYLDEQDLLTYHFDLFMEDRNEANLLIELLGLPEDPDRRCFRFVFTEGGKVLYEEYVSRGTNTILKPEEEESLLPSLPEFIQVINTNFALLAPHNPKNPNLNDILF